MSSDETDAPLKKKRRLGRKLLWALLVLLIGLVWLNGPGWRWLGGIGLRKALAAADMTGDFQLEGTLWGGIRVEKLSLSGGVIRKLEIGAAAPLYEVKRLIHGELDGVAVSSIDAVIDLAAAPPKDPDEPEDPFDPQELGNTLRTVRKIVLPMDLRAANLRFQLVRGEESLVSLGSSDFSHKPGSSEFLLKLGNLAIDPGYEFNPQETSIVWEEESLTLDRFNVTPDLGIRDLSVTMPVGGELAASLEVLVEQSKLIVDGGLSSATVRMEGEPLVLKDALKNLAVEIPADVTLRRLEADIEGFDKTPDLWNARVQAEVIDVRYEDWLVDTLTLDATKSGNEAKTIWSVVALDSALTGGADLRWRNLSEGAWLDFEASANAAVPELAPLFATLNDKFQFAPNEAPPLPDSALSLDATVDSGSDGIRSAGGKLLISPELDAAAFAAEATWTPDGKVDGTFGTDGLRSDFALDLTEKTYDAGATLESFKPERVAPWAAAAGITLPTGMNASLTWKGSGEFAAEPHRGTFDVPSFEWVRDDMPPLVARTTGTYAWPQELELSTLSATADGQTIRMEARLAGNVLEIPKIEWMDGETRLVGGQAEIPVTPETRSAGDFLRQTEPLNLFLESEWIDHSRLAAWLPEKKSPLAGGSARLNLVITGTPAAPKIDLEAALKGLSVADQPDVPVTDATISLNESGGTIKLAGEIKPAGYDPVTLSGTMPFKPGEWAEDPDSLLDVEFEGRADIPRLDLATFKKFVPDAKELAGTLEGFVSAGGTLGEPQLAGELRLDGGTFKLTDSELPPVTNATMSLKLDGKTIRLETLSLDSAGGTLKGSGNVGLENTTKPTFELNLVGRDLPLKRDESMIVRANADLALRGDLEQAGISGTVEIVDSLFYKDIEILPLRMPFTAPSRPNLPAIDPDEKVADIPEPFGRWTLDVRVRTRDPLLIRGNLATGSAIADIRFGGTLAEIQPQGHAILSDLEAKLPFSTLKVHNGAVSFTPAGGLNPELNIRGTSNIGRYDVNLFFYGPVNAPKTALTSDPPLPESEIMTLLATGTTSDGLEDGQAATMKAAQLLVEEWRKGRLPFGEQVGKLLMVLNRVDLRIGENDPLTGQRLNSATIEVTDRIFVSSSVDKQSNTRVLGAFVLRFK